MDNEPTHILPPLQVQPPAERLTIIRETPPTLIRAATPPRARTADPKELAPDLQTRTFDPTKRIMPGVLRRDENGKIHGLGPAPPQAADSDRATVVALQPVCSARTEPHAAEELTVAWQEGRENLAGEFQSIVRRRLAARRRRPARKPGRSRLTWAASLAAATVIALTGLRTTILPTNPRSSEESLTTAQPLLTTTPTEASPESKDNEPADVRPISLEPYPPQLAGLERLAVDALLDGRLDTAQQAYKELLASNPESKAFALTLEIISRGRVP